MDTQCEKCGTVIKFSKKHPNHKARFCSRDCHNQARTKPPATRFLKHVQKTENCWLWTAYKDKKGYGKFYIIGNKFIGAHRFAYQMQFGEIPAGLLICHHCDVPACVNPSHLFSGTPMDNIQDMINKGRGKRKKP